MIDSTRTLHELGLNHVTFGVGAIRVLPSLLHGARSVFVVMDPGLRSAGVTHLVQTHLDGVDAVWFDQVTPNPSVDHLDRVAATMRAAGSDVVLAVGGGSCLDLAKGAALLAGSSAGLRDLVEAAAADGARDAEGQSGAEPVGLPVVAVPTTAGTGSETNGFGVFADPSRFAKRYVGHDSVRPRRVILDPALTSAVPPALTASTGMDALIHCLESWVALDTSADSRRFAATALRLIVPALPAVVADGRDIRARGGMQLGAHLAGQALRRSGLGLIHGIAHAITGRTGAPHGLALTAVADRVIARTCAERPDGYSSLALALGLTADPAGVASFLRDFADAVGARQPLRALGVTADMVEPIASAALADPVTARHPRRFTPAEVAALVAAAR